MIYIYILSLITLMNNHLKMEDNYKISVFKDSDTHIQVTHTPKYRIMCPHYSTKLQVLDSKAQMTNVIHVSMVSC